MTTHTELEFKFAYDPAVALRLAAEGYDPALAPHRMALRTTYYETPQGALRAVCTATFQRSVWRVQASRSLVLELSVDVGDLRARAPAYAAHATTPSGPARLRAPIAELEIERISGTRLAFLRWAAQFAVRHQLRLLHASKQEQGMRLCGLLPALSTPFSAPLAHPASALQPAHTVAQACAAALQADIGQLLANTAALCQGLDHDPETVHQLHIALQRFRTTARAFSLVRQDRRWRVLVAQARAWARTVGQARDADVFATQSWPAVRETFGTARALPSFTRLVDSYCSRCLGQCRQAFCGPKVTAFALQALYLSERLAQGRNAHHQAHPTPTGCDGKVPCRGKGQARFCWKEPVRHFLQVQLQHFGQRLHARLHQAHSAQDWHRARLAAKRLRYTLELALPVLPGSKRHARALHLLAALQHDLGHSNDHAAARRTARQVAALASPGAGQATQCTRALALVDAWSAHCAAPGTLALAAARQIRRLLHR